MTSTDEEATNRLHNLLRCCICNNTHTDPRVLSCFHSACLKCFEDLQSRNKKKPGDVLPCPMCEKEFIIPSEGMKGLQKNFFIESLMEVTNAIHSENNSEPCHSCRMTRDVSDVTRATTRCLNCAENYCLQCSNIHRSQRVSRDHRLIEINSRLTDEEARIVFPTRHCEKHVERVLDYYCSDCKAIVCVSCFVEDHQTHRCEDVTTVDNDFRRILELKSAKMSDYVEQMFSKKTDIETQKSAFLAKTIETGKAIRSRSQQLKALIDRHTQDILDELSLLKHNLQKKFETEIEEVERKIAVLESLATYCTELKSKGSPSEVCGCAENLISRTRELSKENEEFLGVPYIPVEIKFTADEPTTVLQNVGNVVGKLSESMKELESHAVIIGGYDGVSNSNSVTKINMNRSDSVSNTQQLPTEIETDAAASVYCNSLFVTGIGNNYKEIWRFNAASSSWKKCSSMVRGRRGHSVAFVNHVLYICGGWVNKEGIVLDDVEAYDAIDDCCSTVGKLVHAVESSGNCVPFKASLYIFGGGDTTDDAVSYVQVYDTKLNTCTLLSKPMPVAHNHLRAALWENTVILLGRNGCLIYNFDTGIWKVRDQFKTDVTHFGLIVNNDGIFVIGGGNWTKNAAGSIERTYRDDVRYVPVMNILVNAPIEWRHHSILPKPSLISAFGKLNLLV